MKSFCPYMRRRAWILYAVFFLCHFAAFGCVSSGAPKAHPPKKSFPAEFRKIEIRSGVTQKLLLIKADHPVAAVVLLPGGYGKLDIEEHLGAARIRESYSRDFLARSRNIFAEHGLLVSLLDVPSDSPKGIFPDFRMSKQHARDLDSIVSYLKRETKLPVWVIGMSTGAFSAANAAIQGQARISGIVLASASTLSYENWPDFQTYPQGVLSMRLGEIKVPAFIVGHQDDKCFVSSPSNNLKIKEALINCPRAEAVNFKGGRSPEHFKIAVPPDCQPLTFHGFYGIEDQVVGAIGDFIKASGKDKAN